MSRTICLIMSSAVCLCAPAAAKKNVPTIVVVGSPTMREWVTRISGDLDDHLRYPRMAMGQPLPSGYVKVRFHCSEAGTPAEASLFHKSGNRDLDREALRVVNRITSLHPLPVGIGAGRIIQAQLFFATTQIDYVNVIATERRDRAQRAPEIASNELPPIVLGISNRSVSQSTN